MRHICLRACICTAQSCAARWAAAVGGGDHDVEAANDILHHHSAIHSQLNAVTIIRDTGGKLFRNIGETLTLPVVAQYTVASHILLYTKYPKLSIKYYKIFRQTYVQSWLN